MVDDSQKIAAYSTTIKTKLEDKQQRSESYRVSSKGMYLFFYQYV